MRTPSLSRSGHLSCFAAAAGGLVCVCAGPTFGQHAYTGEAGDNLWCTPNNWMPQSVPTGDAVIGPEITQRVRFAGNCAPTFGSLTAQGPVLFDGIVRNSGAILASDVIIQSGGFEVGPAIAGGAMLSMNGVAQWRTGIIARQDVRVEAGATLAIEPSSSHILRTAPLANDGIVTQSATVSLDGLSTITNNGRWTLAAPSVSVFALGLTNPSAFINHGVLECDTGGVAGAPLMNVPVHNEGQINANTGDIDLLAFTSDGGLLGASPGRRINLSRDATFNGASQCSGDGTVAATVGLVRVATGTLLAALDQSGAHAGGFVLNSTPGLFIHANAELRNVGTMTWSRGPIVAEAGLLTPDGALRNEGTFFARAPSATIQNLRFRNVSGGRFVVDVLTQFLLRDSNLVAESGGIIEFRSGSVVRSLQSDPDTPTMLELTNASLLKTTAAPSRISCAIDATSSVVDVRAGELALSLVDRPHRFNATSVEVDSGADLLLEGDADVLDATFRGEGRCRVRNGTANLHLLVGTRTTNEMTGGGMVLESGSITGLGVFDNAGRLTLDSGIVGEAAQLRLENTGHLTVLGAGTSRFDARLVNEEPGIISLQSPVQLAPGCVVENFGELTMSGGAHVIPLPGTSPPALLNEFGGTIRKIGSGSASLSASLSNVGAVVVELGALFISGPVAELSPNTSPAGTYTLSSGSYVVESAGTLSFNGRRIAALRGTTSVTVRGTCVDVSPSKIGDNARFETRALHAPAEQFEATENSRLILPQGATLGTAPGGSNHARFRDGSRLSGGGTVDRDVTVEDQATVAPGQSPGELTLRSLTMNGGELEIEFAGPEPVSGHDRVTVTEQAVLGGTLRLLLLDGFAPTPGSAFTVLTAAGISGQFDQIIPPLDLDDSLRVRVENSGSGTLDVIFSCAADFTLDGGVDGDDVIAFFGAWDAGEIGADFTRDGGVDGDDVIAFFGAWDGGC